MAKTTKLIAIALLASIISTGCKKDDEVKARPTDYNKTLGDIVMKNLYDETQEALSYSAMFDELLYRLATIGEGIPTKRADELYKRVNEKTAEFQKEPINTEYGKYAKNAANTVFTADGKVRDYGTFKEDFAAAKLRADGYTITCNGKNDLTGCNVWDAKTVLDSTSGVVNTYIRDVYQRDVLKEMLNENYIVEAKKSYFSNTQFRKVETVYVDFDAENQIESTNKLYSYEKDLLAGTKTLKDVQEDWQAFKVGLVNAEIAKIGTIDDEDEKLQTKYTCDDIREVCINKARKSADEVEYYKEAEVYTNTATIVNSSITSKLFSSNITTAANKALYLVEDPTNKADGEKWYFFKTFVNEPVLSETPSIVNTDDAGKNYFVRVLFIENASALLGSNVQSDIDLKYELANNLAEKTTNIAGNILYFLNKYKITIHDKAFYDYIKAQYDYPED